MKIEPPVIVASTLHLFVAIRHELLFAKFIDKYNNRRPHSSVGKIPPAVYHKNILNNLVSGIKFAA